MRRAFVTLALCACSACGGAPSASASDPPPGDPAFVVTGAVRFGARLPTSTGASEESWRSAPHVEVAVLDEGGAELSVGRTDETGAFTIWGQGAAALVEIRTRTQIGTETLEVTRDPSGREVHRHRMPVTLGVPVDVAIADAASPVAGALHILTTLRRGLAAVQDWTGRTLPDLFVYWQRGVTTEWSFYRGERGSGRYCLELLGGEPGAQATSDTDEHDEAIILHELGHFVFDRMTTSSSIGGMHARGALLDPGVAWEEGRATWFATAVLGDPAYVDSIGLSPGGSARVDENLETPASPRGLGSETSVAGILWDLADGDGPGAAPDADGDGVSLGPGAVLAAMVDMHVEGESYGAITDLLGHLVRTGAVTEEALTAMLDGTGEPSALARTSWPPELALGATIHGKIDGLTDPAPSGGEARAGNGFDAVAAYRVRVPTPGMLTARLRIAGSGAPEEHTDLDLEVRDLRAEILARSAGTGPIESVGRVVPAGSVIVYVRDGGGGNLAEYELEVEHTPAP